MPAGFCMAYNSRPSNDRHWPSTPRVLLATSTWVWSWGSNARLVRCTNAAATNPVASNWWTPPFPVRVKQACCSRNETAVSTAASCAARTSLLVSLSANAHSSDTDLGGENDNETPVTVDRFL